MKLSTILEGGSEFSLLAGRTHREPVEVRAAAREIYRRWPEVDPSKLDEED